MKYAVGFKPISVKELRKLPTNIQKRIGKKLKYYIDQTDPLDYAIPLEGNGKVGDYRFRTGDYRVIFDFNDDRIEFRRRDIFVDLSDLWYKIKHKSIKTKSKK